MASPFPSISRQEVSALVRQVQGGSLLNRQLSSICQVNGLKSTGVKAELQRRIMDLIQDSANDNDASRFHQIRQSITSAVAQRSSPSSKSAVSWRTMSSPSHSSPSTRMMPSVSPFGNGSNTLQQGGYGGASPSTPNSRPSGSSYSSAMPPLSFPSSAFYTIKTNVSNICVCEVMQSHRHSISIPLKLSDHPSLQHCLSDTSYRVLFFGSTEPNGLQDVVFPQQAEIKVNGVEVKANMRGLKNKPGSTRPVDITYALRLRANQTNLITFTYALTRQKYYVIIFLCRVSTVPELVSAISTRRNIPKESVVREINKKAQDPDVVATSQVLSLKCPLSYMRLQTPCRGLSCTHIQCFDATSYLQLQEQGLQWLCPICNRPAPFDQLAIDGYVKDILENTSDDLEAVTIEPSGQWLLNSFCNEPRDAGCRDLDLVEISEANTHCGHQVETPKNIITTPLSNGSAGSAGASRGIGSTGTKRMASAVIDLTADSDDEEPICGPRKRLNTITNGFDDCDTRSY